MKTKLTMIVICIFFLCSCSYENEDLEQAMSLRTKLKNGGGCAFLATVTADYGDQIYTFSLACEADQNGNMNFFVLEPEYIAGISGKISSKGGELTFDDVILSFPLQSDGVLSPVSAPWICLRTLREGYVRSCGKEGEYVRLTADDSYEMDALMLDIWLDGNSLPIQADIYENNRRIFEVQIIDFCIR